MNHRARPENDPDPEAGHEARAGSIEPKSTWRGLMLTREDIGYGPARPYEGGGGVARHATRERRGQGRVAQGPPITADSGPYQQRLQRRERPDHWIQADIEEALFFDTWIDANRITVEVRRGVATLIGTMPSRAEAERALDNARRVPGLRQLRNRLEVEA